MTTFSAHKTPIFIAVIAVCIALLASCNDRVKATGGLAEGSQSSAVRNQPAKQAGQSDSMYFGEDWADQSAVPGVKPSESNPAARNPANASASAADANAIWTLVLGTFSDVGHEQAAHQMLANLRTVAPQIMGARVHSTAKGSMVIYGNYTGRDDANAKADQERLKQIAYQGRQVFNRVILTRIDLRLSHAQLHPFDLLSARKAHPNVDPLYTLDVAIWMANSDAKNSRDRVTFDEVKRKAEAYAAELRARNEQAYFYHDDVNQWSMVTVGLFDRRAIDSRSGLYSNDVDALVRRFPVRLANGEPLMEFKNRHAPKQGTRPQSPKLVLVPSM